MALRQVEIRLYPCATVLRSRKRQSLGERKWPEGNGFLTEMQGAMEAEVQVHLPPFGAIDDIHQSVHEVQFGRNSARQRTVLVLLMFVIALCDVSHAHRPGPQLGKRTSAKEFVKKNALGSRANEHDVCPERRMQCDVTPSAAYLRDVEWRSRQRRWWAGCSGVVTDGLLKDLMKNLIWEAVDVRGHSHTQEGVENENVW